MNVIINKNSNKKIAFEIMERHQWRPLIGEQFRHAMAALFETIGKLYAFFGVAIDFPGPLAGERKLDQPHESGHVLGRIADEQAYFMGKCCGVFNTETEFRQQVFSGHGRVVPCPAKQDADTGVSEMVLELSRMIAEQQQGTPCGLQQLEPDIGKIKGKLFMMGLPELIQVPAAGSGPINQGYKAGWFDTGHNLGALQQQMRCQAVYRNRKTRDDLLADVFRRKRAV